MLPRPLVSPPKMRRQRSSRSLRHQVGPLGGGRLEIAELGLVGLAEVLEDLLPEFDSFEAQLFRILRLRQAEGLFEVFQAGAEFRFQRGALLREEFTDII